MICNYTRDEFIQDSNDADLKLVTGDSDICHYCARRLDPDDEFEDAEKCNECIHGKYGRMTGINHFLGIQCVTWKEE